MRLPSPHKAGSDGVLQVSDLSNRKLLVCGLLVALHLPLIYQVIGLYRELPAGAGVTDLTSPSLLLLVVLFVLPYALLPIFGIRWNPERARLNEYID